MYFFLFLSPDFESILYDKRIREEEIRSEQTSGSCF